MVRDAAPLSGWPAQRRAERFLRVCLVIIREVRLI
jgi:hypothetical protein